ncbi:aldo/keto reductase [Salinispira pacifica]|uniref:Aldo/keto reductase n=1 Tax=Salinispira pacifica TaxID=1307761 RepID=V5WLZ3_9SPIO|nr:aldo/keto reductase [Salinispira pacifica]AHC16116.1 aldo/keto reductase [Salinispira pacifica]
MNYRRFGKTEWKVSEVSLGTWQVGGKWGSGFDDALAERILNRAIDLGVNFIDTADVYENRKSEAAVARVIKSRSEQVYMATKCGRFLNPHVSESYTPAALREFVEASLKNTRREQLDLIQLHCPPTEVFYRPEIFETFERLKDEGKILHLGVSVEKVEEGLKAMEYPNVVSVQIIFNMFRQRPSDLFFARAKEKDCGVLVRVPLASGLLSGKFTKESNFSPDDHRNFNRDGAAFDKGETFAGIPFETGVDAADALKGRLPQPLAGSALRWILDHPEVSTVIPGASRVEQLESNVSASDASPLSSENHQWVNEVYGRYIRDHVHQRW